MTITGADFSAVLDAIVAKVAAAGIPASRDPGDFQPPGAIVSAPTIGGGGVATLQTFAMAVPVYLVTDQLGADGTDWLLAAVAVVLPVFGESSAEPVPWISPINPNGLPAMVVTVHANVSTT